MSYKYNPYRDTFEHVPDEEPITISAKVDSKTYTVEQLVNLTDESIDRIADAVARKLREKSDG